ncbi:MAG TPA: hypothetical protein VJB87_05825 [Candidatus Nanoarchaeia archaeon]|nr:hypothetical protein [Candidatus Nanoarchaeia archaeon]
MAGLERVVDGETWLFRFLDTCSVIPEKERMEIMERAIRMDNKGRRERRCKIKGEHYEGSLWGTGKWHSVEGYGGYEYRAKIDTDKGKYSLGILLQKRIDPSCN